MSECHNHEAKMWVETDWFSCDMGCLHSSKWREKKSKWSKTQMSKKIQIRTGAPSPAQQGTCNSSRRKCGHELEIKCSLRFPDSLLPLSECNARVSAAAVAANKGSVKRLFVSELFLQRARLGAEHRKAEIPRRLPDPPIKFTGKKALCRGPGSRSTGSTGKTSSTRSLTTFALNF